MLKFGILGIGQGGSSIAEYALTKGFKTTKYKKVKKLNFIKKRFEIFR